MKTVIRVDQVRGYCPVYKEGDAIVLDEGYIIDPAQSSRICLHSLAPVMPYYVALSHGVEPTVLGLNRDDNKAAFVQCPDPCERTGGGTVTLEIRQME
jgi:uncharacterized repeat protein (TIGR04076 family)